MNQTLDAVSEHYGPPGLIGRLKAALAGFGPEDQLLQPEQLAGLDQFHTRGLAATRELAALAGIGVETVVLDVGSGIGGPARFLAATFGCKVTGVDLSQPFVDGARYLTQRTGQIDRVTFEVGSALELPLPDSSFDVALLQHVAMNIQDRAGLYHEIHRVLHKGGTFATYDIVLRSGDPHYPVPWATSPATSFLLPAEATSDAIKAAGFVPVVIQDNTEAAKVWAEEVRASDAPPMPHLGVVMGSGFPELTGNLARNLLEDRIGVLTAVFRVEGKGDTP